MCHMYFNWAGTVRGSKHSTKGKLTFEISVPAPCQNAHKVAYLTGKSLHEEPAYNLRHLLYYL